MKDKAAGYIVDDSAIDGHALESEVMALPTVVIVRDDRSGHVEEMLLVAKITVLGLIKRHLREDDCRRLPISRKSSTRGKGVS